MARMARVDFEQAQANIAGMALADWQAANASMFDPAHDSGRAVTSIGAINNWSQHDRSVVVFFVLREWFFASCTDILTKWICKEAAPLDAREFSQSQFDIIAQWIDNNAASAPQFMQDALAFARNG